ncbi:MAG: hypothetical protein FWG90_07135 [Oscillospiraceae bacterium]|nr:hypothetical protein [Oscillospiraceae bacterium]
MKEKPISYLGMGILAFLFLGMDVVVLLVTFLFYGTMDFSARIEAHGFSVMLLQWGLTSVMWAAGVFSLYSLAKKKGYNVLENNSARAPLKNWIIVFALLIAAVIGQLLMYNMQFKPLVEFLRMRELFSSYAILAFIIQYIYYAFEVSLFLSVIVYGQKFGEIVFRKENIPWGGILCGLLWGLLHIFTKDLLTGIYLAAFSLVYGFVYLLLQKNVKYTYIVLALMFIL